jgi:hypothetical protein
VVERETFVESAVADRNAEFAGAEEKEKLAPPMKKKPRLERESKTEEVAAEWNSKRTDWNHWTSSP